MRHPLALVLLACAACGAAAEPVVRKIFPERRLHQGDAGILPVEVIDSAAWIWHPDLNKPIDDGSHGRYKPERLGHFSAGWRGPVFLRFRRSFEATAAPLRFHISADERYELFLDGRRIARGPDRSDVEHWAYASYEATLAPGPHRIEALCWHLGPYSPIAQLSHRGGFVLKAEGDYDKALTTGSAPWEVARLEGYAFSAPADGGVFGTGAQFDFQGCGPQWKEGDFAKAVVVRPALNPKNVWGESAPGWKMFPSTLPERLDRTVQAGRAVAAGEAIPKQEAPIPAEAAQHADVARWQVVIAGGGDITIPAKSERWLLWDLDDYWCAHPRCDVSGGAGGSIAWGWAESLHQPKKPGAKGDRSAFAGKAFAGVVDTFRPDGGAHRLFSTPWWRAGRWCLVTVTTSDEPLTIHRLSLDETRYPLEYEGSFTAAGQDLAGVIRLAVRGMQMCSHETLMDCPFYEQLMYDGDSRLEMLTTYAMTRDDRLMKRCIELFDFSRRNGGLVNERFPAHLPQHSSTFSLIWALMVADHMLWRNDPAFIRARAIGLRSMLEHFEPYRDASGLVSNLPGWSFIDWVDGWKTGNAPDGEKGLSALNNLFYVYALQRAAAVEDALGEPLLAQRLRAKAAQTAAAVRERFWDEGRGLIADTIDRKHWSEHAQCLALLTDTVTDAQAKRCYDGLNTATDLKRATIYFSFYLLETWQKFGDGGRIVDRLAFWKDLVAQGFKTPPESPHPRSDCHAWGSHPLFHLHASLAGVRPASPWFRTVRIAPQPGALPAITCRTPHPDGEIGVDLQFASNRCTGTVELPAGITGTFVWQGVEKALTGGKQSVDMGK